MPSENIKILSYPDKELNREILKRQINFSINITKELPFIYEPQSSFSIKMNENYTEIVDSAESGVTITSAHPIKSTSTTNPQKRETTFSLATTLSSVEQSIEEEIEEALDISSGNENVSNEKLSIDNLGAEGLEKTLSHDLLSIDSINDEDRHYSLDKSSKNKPNEVASEDLNKENHPLYLTGNSPVLKEIEYKDICDVQKDENIICAKTNDEMNVLNRLDKSNESTVEDISEDLLEYQYTISNDKNRKSQVLENLNPPKGKVVIQNIMETQDKLNNTVLQEINDSPDSSLILEPLLQNTNHGMTLNEKEVIFNSNSEQDTLLTKKFEEHSLEYLTLKKNDHVNEMIAKKDASVEESIILNTNSENVDEGNEKSMKLMKLHIRALQNHSKELPLGEINSSDDMTFCSESKQMERMSLLEFNRDVLEDITEETERNSLSTEEDLTPSLEQSKSLHDPCISSALPKSLSQVHPENTQLVKDVETSSSNVSLNMLKLLEQKVSELELILVSKDAYLSSLQLQLDSLQKREMTCANTEQPGSGRDTSSLITSSTEYRTLQEDFGIQATDMLLELTERDEIISKLTKSLQLSMDVREKLQIESEKLNHDMMLLRKQLNEAMNNLEWKHLPTTYPQKPDDVEHDIQSISDTSKLLVAESKNVPEQELVIENEENNFRVKQSDIQFGNGNQIQWVFSFDELSKNLSPDEARLFIKIKKKLNDFLCNELEKCREDSENKHKIAIENLNIQNSEKDKEIEKLMLQREEKEKVHSMEMEELRKYFENKCAELEKQFSNDVFSQKSESRGDKSAESEASENEQMFDMSVPLPNNNKEMSPRKRARNTLLNSPSHRQLTPFTMDNKDEEDNLNEIKSFYQNKIKELEVAYDEKIRRVTEKMKYYEKFYPGEDYMNDSWPITTVTAYNASNTAMHNDVHSSGNINNIVNVDNPEETAISDEVKTSLIIIDKDEINFNNESQVIQKIITEYEHRLREQVAFAREDIVQELEKKIRNLLSETGSDDQHWPKELILLREKLTAKSQLEIAQLQISHAEEMSRLRNDYEKQLNRKYKRNITFDSARELNQILCERDSLRELSKSFRIVLSELAKFVASCEVDLNASIIEEVQRHLKYLNNRSYDDGLKSNDLNQSSPNNSLFNTTFNNSSIQCSQRFYVPDVHGIIEVVDNPSLLHYISTDNPQNSEDFDISECLDRLNKEAAYLLTLSEELTKRRKHVDVENRGIGEIPNNLRFEAELKQILYDEESKCNLVNSLDEQHLSNNAINRSITPGISNMISLPVDLNRIQYLCNDGSSDLILDNGSELNLQIVELKNRLTKSESDRSKLQIQLENTISRNTELGNELQLLRDQISQLNSITTEYSEGYGLGSTKVKMKTSQLEDTHSDNCMQNFIQLQDRARLLLGSPQTQQHSKQTYEEQKVASQTKDVCDETILLLQIIEDFCREGDKIVETNRKSRDDFQAQISTADKQLKATRQFLEEQAAEREQERDDFVREIENLKTQLRDIEKERNTYANASEEVFRLESQLRDLTQQHKESQSKSEKFEIELKASIDKIFVLREIITELETQVETKSLNEHVQLEKIKQLEEYINAQSRSNDILENDIQTLRLEIDQGYKTRIQVLEEKLKNIRPKAEQSIVMDQIVEQLRDIESVLEQKTKSLEAVHQASFSNSCSLSATEDISVHDSKPSSLNPLKTTASPLQESPVHPSPRQHLYTMEVVQRIIEKLSKHNRVEEAAIKRIVDLDMQLIQIRNSYLEIQQERDCLQERMCEQTQRISALQSKIEEQRQRAEDLQRANTTELNIRIHDLQNEVQTLTETLSNRDKQLKTVKHQLEKSKTAIDRLEAELLVEQNPDRSRVERLETDLKEKNIEIKKLKDKIKNEMINKLALPDLMETMLADKNEEIDHLREQLEAKEKECTGMKMHTHHESESLNVKIPSNRYQNDDNINRTDAIEEPNSKLSARTLSDIISISEYDEPDVVRRAALQQNNSPLLLPEGNKGIMKNYTLDCSKEVNADLTQKRSEDLLDCMAIAPINTFEHPHYFQDPNTQATAVAELSYTVITPGLIPRYINFSNLTEDSKFKTPTYGIPTPDQFKEQLQQHLSVFEMEMHRIKEEKHNELLQLQQDLALTEKRLKVVTAELTSCKHEMQCLKDADLMKTNQIDLKTQQIQQHLRLQSEQAELLTKQEKDICNYKENERQYQDRIDKLEKQLLQITSKEVDQCQSLRKELYAVSEAHSHCKRAYQEIEILRQDIKIKDENFLQLKKQMVIAEQNIIDLERALDGKQQEINLLIVQIKKQQQSSESSSRQFSVDEIAQQVEKELNYSAQLDSNILKAIESEEENNFDKKELHPEQNEAIVQLTKPQLEIYSKSHQNTVCILPKTESTDDENYIGERVLLNQIEALKAQMTIEREQSESIRQELLQEKQHSQEIQEQDVVIIEAMRKRLENSLEKEDELHKHLDVERERCERLQTQLTALMRSESRRNSLILLKSPNESPRKSPRQHNNFDSQLAERLRSEIKMLSAQNERERERFKDLQESIERERQRHDTELQERIVYCERLQKDVNKLSREKENAKIENAHLQERLTLQTAELESLETRLVTLQEAESRRTSRRERHHKDNARLLLELQEIKTRLLSRESEREELTSTIIQLRKDVERSKIRDAQLTDALANANEQLGNTTGATATVPEQFLQKMKEINALLAHNTQENRQMAETVQFLVEERRELQKKCEELQHQLCTGNPSDLEERCNYLFGRYLRVESHRKALVYQKRYLKLSLQRYLENEERLNEHLLLTRSTQFDTQDRATKNKLFKTVALAIIAIERMKYIGRIWHTGKRIVSRSVFTITQQKRTAPVRTSAPDDGIFKQNIEIPNPALRFNTLTPSSPMRSITDHVL